MKRRVRARVMASRRGTGVDKGRAATRPREGEMAALQSASTFPGSLTAGRPIYAAEVQVRILAGEPSLESSGAVTALTAATPDHNLGIGPRSNDR